MGKKRRRDPRNISHPALRMSFWLCQYTRGRHVAGTNMNKYLIACALLWSVCSCAQGQPARPLSLDGVDLRVELDESAFRGGADPIMGWIRRSLGIVAD